jgi:hypothetical protein
MHDIRSRKSSTWSERLAYLRQRLNRSFTLGCAKPLIASVPMKPVE